MLEVDPSTTVRRVLKIASDRLGVALLQLRLEEDPQVPLPDDSRLHDDAHLLAFEAGMPCSMPPAPVPVPLPGRADLAESLAPPHPIASAPPPPITCCPADGCDRYRDGDGLGEAWGEASADASRKLEPRLIGLPDLEPAVPLPLPCDLEAPQGATGGAQNESCVPPVYAFAQ